MRSDARLQPAVFTRTWHRATADRARAVIAVLALVVLGSAGGALRAQNPIQPLAEQPLPRETLTPAPPRAQGEGFGPYATMVIRGATLIDGTGGPPRGPGGTVGHPNRDTPLRP